MLSWISTLNHLSSGARIPRVDVIGKYESRALDNITDLDNRNLSPLD
jgi:hypothetical protein